MVEWIPSAFLLLLLLILDLVEGFGGSKKGKKEYYYFWEIYKIIVLKRSLGFGFLWGLEQIAVLGLPSFSCLSVTDVKQPPEFWNYMSQDSF